VNNASDAPKFAERRVDRTKLSATGATGTAESATEVDAASAVEVAVVSAAASLAAGDGTTFDQTTRVAPTTPRAAIDDPREDIARREMDRTGRSTCAEAWRGW
jgi:hypothetical protein